MTFFVSACASESALSSLTLESPESDSSRFPFVSAAFLTPARPRLRAGAEAPACPQVCPVRGCTLGRPCQVGGSGLARAGAPIPTPAQGRSGTGFTQE